MPMYWDAYLADTTHLSTEEHGAYILLLAAMWRRNGWVPDDDRDNARILGLTTAKWRKIKARLSGFLVFEDGEISQKKLLETWRITQEKIEKNRTNGAKGGRPKSSKSNGLTKAKASLSVNPNKSLHNQNHNNPQTPKIGGLSECAFSEGTADAEAQKLDGLADFWAGQISKKRFVSASSFNAVVARRMVERELVTETQLRDLGIAV